MTGIGYDVHPLVSNRPLVLGGVSIPHSHGLAGHSDADVLCHAIADAVLGALGEPDIGHFFPPDDPACKDMVSLRILEKCRKLAAASGFEIVQSHLPDWQFNASDSVADGGLHAHLLVGHRIPVGVLATSASELDSLLAATQVSLWKGDLLIDKGSGANVLDSPLRALHHFLLELRQCPGAPDLIPGDVVTTGTWTDAWPVKPGECWTGTFGMPLSPLEVELR